MFRSDDIHREVKQLKNQLSELINQKSDKLNQKWKGNNTLLHVFIFYTYHTKDTTPYCGNKLDDIGLNKNDIEQIINFGLDVNATNDVGETPLHLASEYGFHDIVELLIQNGANPNVADNAGYTPLHLASRLNYSWLHPNKSAKAKAAQILISNGADINATTHKGLTPLQLAIVCNQEKIVKWLIEAKVDLKKTNQCGSSPLPLALKEKRKQIATWLINEINTDLEATDNDSTSPLSLAIKNGFKKIAEKLIDLGVSLDQQDRLGNTALHFAIFSGNTEIALKLIASGANVNIVNNGGYAPLHLAVRNPKILESLITNGADTNLICTNKTFYGWTALHLAIKDYRETAALLLIQAGANLDIPMKKGNTALLMAIYKDQEEVAKCLIKAKADLNLANKYGTTPLQLAAMSDQKTIAQELITNGADINAANSSGYTPLHLAILHGSEIDKLLIKNGADISAKNVRDLTPFNNIELKPERFNDLVETYLNTLPQPDDLIVLIDLESKLASLQSIVLSSGNKLSIKTLQHLLNIFKNTAGVEQIVNHVSKNYSDKDILDLFSSYYNEEHKNQINKSKLELAVIYNYDILHHYNQNQVKNNKPKYIPDMESYVSRILGKLAANDTLDYETLESLFISGACRITINGLQEKHEIEIPLPLDISKSYELYQAFTAALKSQQNAKINEKIAFYEYCREDTIKLLIAGYLYNNPQTPIDTLFDTVTRGLYFDEQGNQHAIYSGAVLEYILANKEDILNNIDTFLRKKYEIDREDLISLISQHRFLSEIKLTITNQFGGSYQENIGISLKNLRTTFACLDSNQQYDQIETYTAHLNLLKVEMIKAAKQILMRSKDHQEKAAARSILIDLTGIKSYVNKNKQEITIPFVLFYQSEVKELDNYLLASTTALTPTPFYYANQRLVTPKKLRTQFGGGNRQASANRLPPCNPEFMDFPILEKQEGRGSIKVNITNERVWTLNAFLDVMAAFVDYEDNELAKLRSEVNTIVAELLWDFDLNSIIPFDITESIHNAIKRYQNRKLSYPLQSFISVLDKLMYFEILQKARQIDLQLHNIQQSGNSNKSYSDDSSSSYARNNSFGNIINPNPPIAHQGYGFFNLNNINAAQVPVVNNQCDRSDVSYPLVTDCEQSFGSFFNSNALESKGSITRQEQKSMLSLDVNVNVNSHLH